jgi:phosphatidylserine/phosphatidylglycerophosphate/cardiolipin synthase-like enzyme
LEKKVIAVLVVALLLGGIVGYYVAQPDDEIVKLESEISTLQSEYTNLSTQYNELITDYAELEQLLETELIDVYFSPYGGAASQVINWIDHANETIHVLIYSFTNDDIGDAVVRAYQRGVEIKVVFEKTQISQYSEYMKLRTTGIQARNDTNSGLMHHKVAVIDGYIILTGSFNWSASAEERNNENLMVIRSQSLATTFEEEVQRIWNISV